MARGANSAEPAPRRARRRARDGGDDPRHAGQRGVILLDVVLTLAVLLLAFRVVWPLMPFTTSPARQVAYAHEIAALIDADRIAAARRGQVVTTRIDVRGKRFVGGAGGWSVALPSDVALEVLTTTECTVDPDHFALGFGPDGRSCGLSLGLARDGRTIRVSVNWLTGLVEVTGGARGRG